MPRQTGPSPPHAPEPTRDNFKSFGAGPRPKMVGEVAQIPPWPLRSAANLPHYSPNGHSWDSMGIYGRQWRVPGATYRHTGKHRNSGRDGLQFWLTTLIAASGRSRIQMQTNGVEAYPLLIRGRRSRNGGRAKPSIASGRGTRGSEGAWLRES